VAVVNRQTHPPVGANGSQNTHLRTLLKMLYEFLRHHPYPRTPAINQHLVWDPRFTLRLPIPQPALNPGVSITARQFIDRGAFAC